MRANRLESIVEASILKYVRPQKIDRESNYGIIKKWKLINDGPKLFYDAKSPAKTYNDNERETEFVLHYPVFNIDWRIECKDQKANSDGMVNRIVKDIQDVKYLDENMLILVIDGILLKPSIIKAIYNWCQIFEAEGRVWVGNPKEFENMLFRKVSYPKK